MTFDKIKYKTHYKNSHGACIQNIPQATGFTRANALHIPILPLWKHAFQTEVNLAEPVEHHSSLIVAAEKKQ